jgi:hypothetical protein
VLSISEWPSPDCIPEMFPVWLGQPLRRQPPGDRHARVRLGMIQLAWRFLWFQKDSALGRWYRERTAAAPGARKTLIVALARKLLIALWRLVREGVVPEGLRLRPAA